jgi:hypothetical protein
MGILVTTKETDGRTLQTGIHMMGAEVLAPVVFEPEKGIGMPGGEWKSLERACDDQKEVMPSWLPWVVIGGVGLYSLRKAPAGVLAKFDILFRDANEWEINHDFYEYGEQVLGPEVGTKEGEACRNNPTFAALGSRFYYIGPPRIVKVVFATRVFPGGLPDRKGLARLAQEVEEVALKGSTASSEQMVTPQGYLFFHADRGRLCHAGFEKIENYDPEATGEKVWGTLEVDDARKSLTFFAHGNRSDPKDFSGAYIEPK